MKRIATLVGSFLCLCGMASLAQAQLVPPPAITSVPSRDAFNPGRVQILGTNMGIVTGVKVNGVSVPIIRRTATKVVAGPVAPVAPGIGTVEIKSGLGDDSAPIQFTPTLDVTRRRDILTVTLDADDVGTYVLRYNRALLGSPVTDPGIYYQRFFALTGTGSGVLRSGVFADSEPITFTARMPVQIGMTSNPLYLQAECVVGVSEVRTYTNLDSVSGFVPF